MNTTQHHPRETAHIPLQSAGDCDMILVSRKELETEERQLLSRIQLLRRLLGKPPLLTGKQLRLARAAE